MSTETRSPSTYRCLVASKDDLGNVSCQVQQRNFATLNSGEVTVKVLYSSLNYKDALAATGHPGVARSLPLVPGIDAAGEVITSNSPRFSVGDNVILFNAEFGTKADGGYSEFARVPADWALPLPAGMTLLDAMTIGTGGFTAAQCVDKLLNHHVNPKSGEIVVTGATGGVGIFSVKLLDKLGFNVVASTGKHQLADWLKQHGAKTVISRTEVDDRTDRPLLTSRWGGAVDTVGGNTLATILRSTKPHGCVTACGVVGGAALPVTVFPFILRGVALQGIDSASISQEYRSELWGKLANEWRIDDLDKLITIVSLEELPHEISRILRGEIAGRVVVDLQRTI